MGGSSTLRRRIEEIGEEAGAERVAVAIHDYETRTGWSHHGDVWFHAASTIKIPVLLGVFAALEEGRLAMHSRVHIRNRFLSVADGEPFRIDASRDSTPRVHAAVGQTLSVKELARHMIVTSSNLATNVLLDLVGLDRTQAALRQLGLEGIELVRGVEDERAWARGSNNRVTADGLLHALRRIEEEHAFSPEASREMLDILHGQEFRNGIPAGLPEQARVAHKTGEISTVAHDAGIVYLPERRPYVVVILTEWKPEGTGRQAAIARISRTIFEHLMEGDEGHDG